MAGAALDVGHAGIGGAGCHDYPVARPSWHRSRLVRSAARLGYIKRAFLLGFPGSIELSTRGLGLVIMSFLVASFGTLPIAAYGVGSNIVQVVTIPAMGLSMAVSTLVDQNIGAGNWCAHPVSPFWAPVGFASLPWSVLWPLFRALIVAFFVPGDAEVIAEGAHLIRIMCLAWGAWVSSSVSWRRFGRLVNMLIAMVVALVSQCMIQFPLAYVLSNHTVLQARRSVVVLSPSPTFSLRWSRWAGSRVAPGRRRG